ncbi:MAG: zinc ribbon domain-containing protein [Phycisphaerae bacterium]
MGTKIGLGVVLIALIGISVYMWTSQEETGADMAIGEQMEQYTCSNCNTTFELTNAEASEMYRAGKGVVCPECGTSDAEKQGVDVTIGFLTPADVETADATEDEEEAPPAQVGVMGRKSD